MSWYFLELKDTSEFIDSTDLGCVELKAGACIIAFCDVDWAALEEKCEALRNEHRLFRKLSVELAKWYRELCSELSPMHPLLHEFVRHQLVGDMKSILMEHFTANIDSPEWHYVEALESGKKAKPISDEFPRLFLSQLSKRFHSFSDIQDKLIPMLDFVMDTHNENPELSILQRYFCLRQQSRDYAELTNSLYPLLRTEFHVQLDGKTVDFSLRHSGKPMDMSALETQELSAHTFQVSDYLEALVLWELDYLAANEIALRRCDYCDRYFIPYSVVSCYCDRPLADRPDKTCKDIGAASKHQQEVSDNAAKTLYKKVNNRMQTWASRHAEQYPDARKMNYKQWQYEAQSLLEQVDAGELTYEDFAEKIDKPPKEALGL